METNQVEKLCLQVESKVKAIIQEAKKAFDERITAMKNIDKMYSDSPMMASLTHTSAYNLIENGGKVEMKKDESRFSAQLKSEIEPLIKELERLSKKLDDIDDFVCLVNKLENLARLTETLNYPASKYSISVQECHSCVDKVAKQWRSKMETDPQIKKEILKVDLQKNQEELEKTENELVKNQKLLNIYRDDLTQYFGTYEKKVQIAIEESAKDYKGLLKNLEEKQQHLLEKSKERISAIEGVAKASIFAKKGKEKELRSIEQDYQRISNEISSIEKKINDFFGSAFFDKFKALNGKIDEMFAKIEAQKEVIKNNEISIDAHKNVIERIKGDLNGK